MTPRGGDRQAFSQRAAFHLVEQMAHDGVEFWVEQWVAAPGQGEGAKAQFGRFEVF